MKARHSPTPGNQAAQALDAGALTRAIRRGDEAAFEQFYEGYCDRLFRLLLAWTRGDEAIAQEVLQTVMIKLARKLPVIEAERELWSWLARVTRHTLVDHWRRNGRADAMAIGEVESLLENPAENNFVGEQLGWLEEAVASLDAEDRWLVDEFYFKRRSQQELAGELGKTPKAIESKLARIRQSLRSAWQQRMNHEQT